MPSLSMNLVKRIDRLPKPTNATGALQPLFEAVSNSIHAVTDIHFAGTRTTTAFLNVGTAVGTRKMPQTKIILEQGLRRPLRFRLGHHPLLTLSDFNGVGA